MLPDFPEVKRYARRQFLRAVQRQIAQDEPILRQVRHSRVHEGATAVLTRADASTADVEFQKATAELAIAREQMRSMSIEDLLKHVKMMSDQFAEQQARMMFAKISEAVEEVGNTVSARELGAKEAFLEMNRRLETDFDPETLEPKNQVIVLHPSQVESFRAQVEEWNKDPAFVEELSRIKQAKIEEWRARENRRKLVD